MEQETSTTYQKKRSTLRNFYLPVIIPIVIGAIGYFLMGDAYYELKNNVGPEQVITLLLNYAVLATLIERFVNKLVIPEQKSLARKAKFKLINMSISENDEKNQLAKIQEHEISFTWIGFGLSIMVSCFGFRFFSNIFNVTGGEVVYPLIDIFLTSIIIAGGAHFVNSLIDILHPSKDTTPNTGS